MNIKYTIESHNDHYVIWLYIEGRYTAVNPGFEMAKCQNLTEEQLKNIAYLAIDAYCTGKRNGLQEVSDTIKVVDEDMEISEMDNE